MKRVVLPIRTVAREEASPDSHPPLHRGIPIGAITDGAANTFLIGTVGQHFKPWGHPANLRDPALGINRSPAGFSGPPQWGGTQFGMCDGSARLFSQETDPAVIAALGTIAHGEQIDPGQE